MIFSGSVCLAGSKNFLRLRGVGISMKIDDKIQRLENLEQNNRGK